ncbi:MAG: hypothetical protein ACTHMI_13320 [Mucilaginibacter sp.]
MKKYYILSSLLVLALALILFTTAVDAQMVTKPKLKTNANDSVTVRQMFSTKDGLGDGVRVYKTLGRNVLFLADTMTSPPQYPGGMKAFKDAVVKMYDQMGIPINGVFKIIFTVDYNGHMKHVKIWWSVAPGVDKKVIRKLKGLPAWTPGIINGKYVKAEEEVQLGW